MYPFSEFDLPDDMKPAAEDEKKKPCVTAIVLMRQGSIKESPARPESRPRKRVLVEEMEESTR